MKEETPDQIAQAMAGNKKLSRDGLPLDPKEWTKADWQDLHNAIEKAKRAISKRHKEE